MGDRITNGVNPGPLQAQISVLLLFAICIHSGTNVFIELPDNSLFCIEIIYKLLLGKQTETGNVDKTMRVHVLGWVVKALLRQLLWWKSIKIHTNSAKILFQVIV